MNIFKCKFCNRETTNAGANKAHENRCVKNPNKVDLTEKQKRKYSNSIPWNKGLDKLSNESVKKQSESLAEGYKTGRIQTYEVSEIEKEKRSIRAKEICLGGYRPHPNKGSYYKNTWFDSKWEVQVARSLDENNIKWERPRYGFIWNEKGNKYYPDFYLVDHDVYLDPKNEFLQKKDKIKIEEAQRINNIKVIVLSENQLEWKNIAPIVQR